MADIRRYAAEARSTDVLGRLRLEARHHHVLVDGPPWNGFPGEELMPGELFLGGVATCAVELIQMFSRDDGVPIGDVHVQIASELDLDDQSDPHHMLFNRVRMAVEVVGVPQAQAEQFVDRFKAR